MLAIIKPHDGTGVGAKELKPGERGEIVLDHTPFYADAGGQVGDVGWLYGEDHNTLVAEVEGATYPVQGVRAHRVVAKQTIHVGDKVDAMVNDEVRRATMRNHTGTHLLHAALREVLGKHVKQAGSLVDPGHLRFDFSHFASLDDEELQDIEDLANKEVLRNDRVEVIEDVPIDVAVNEYHAMALFGEKYGDRVRVIRIGDFSTELCGGTHTAATGEIGLIKILKEGSVSSGVRRLEAVTGEGSLRHFRKDHQLENVVATLVRGGDDQSPAEALRNELDRREDELKKLRKELEQARMKSASSSVSSATENVREVKGVKVLATRADNLERTQLRTLVDNLRNKLGSGVVVMGSVSDGHVALIVGVTKDLTSRVQAGKIIAEVAKKWAAPAADVPTWPRPGEGSGGVWMRPWRRVMPWWKGCCTVASYMHLAVELAFSQRPRHCLVGAVSPTFRRDNQSLLPPTGKQQVRSRLRLSLPLGMTVERMTGFERFHRATTAKFIRSSVFSVSPW